MATRQYIGARYVPKFYTNTTDGSTQWQPNVVYDPMIWVTLTNGHMYISKKQVPATVGTPAENMDYWLDIGSYNGWVEQMQDKIDALNGRLTPVETDVANLKTWQETADSDINNLQTAIIDTNTELVALKGDVDVLKNRRVVIICDSYGNYGAQPTDNFVAQLGTVSKGKYVENTNVYKFAYDGRGLVGNESAHPSNASYYTCFITSGDYATVEDRDTITDVIVLGGGNDIGAQESALMSAASTLYDALHTNFPKAKISLGMYYFTNNTTNMTQIAEIEQIYNALNRFGFVYITGAHRWFHYSDYMADASHPNANGMLRIAQGLYNYLEGMEWSFDVRPINLVWGQDGLTNYFEPTSSWDIKTYMSGDTIGIISEGVSLSYAAGLKVATDTGWQTLCSIASTFMQGGIPHPQTVFIQFTSGGTVYNTVGMVRVYQRKIQIAIPPIVSSLTNMTTLYVGRFAFEVPASHM